MSSATEAHVRTLSNGRDIPIVALGTWKVADRPPSEDAVRWALELGYRHIDTAQVYGNETSVGRALAQSGVPRDQLFVTTKFNHSHKDPAAELERSLQRLGLECVDLYLIHWPQRGPIWTWPGMERALGLHRNAKRMLEHVWAPSRAGVGRACSTSFRMRQRKSAVLAAPSGHVR